MASSSSKLGKIFVGGLSYETTDEKLSNYFSSYGTVTDSVVMRDPISRRSRGFGFITFTDEDCVDRALEKKIHLLDSRKVEAKRAVPRDNKDFTTAVCQSLAVSENTLVSSTSSTVASSDPSSSITSSTSTSTVIPNNPCYRSSSQYPSSPHAWKGGGGQDASRPVSVEMETKKIFVGGLHYETQDVDFRAYFETFGKVTSAEVMFNRETYKSRGFGFVVFAEVASVDAVLQERTQILDGKIVEVKRAVPRTDSPPRSTTTTTPSTTLHRPKRSVENDTEMMSPLPHPRLKPPFVGYAAAVRFGGGPKEDATAPLAVPSQDEEMRSSAMSQGGDALCQDTAPSSISELTVDFASLGQTSEAVTSSSLSPFDFFNGTGREYLHASASQQHHHHHHHHHPHAHNPVTTTNSTSSLASSSHHSHNSPSDRDFMAYPTQLRSSAPLFPHTNSPGTFSTPVSPPLSQSDVRSMNGSHHSSTPPSSLPRWHEESSSSSSSTWPTWHPTGIEPVSPPQHLYQDNHQGTRQQGGGGTMGSGHLSMDRFDFTSRNSLNEAFYLDAGQPSLSTTPPLEYLSQGQGQGQEYAYGQTSHTSYHSSSVSHTSPPSASSQGMPSTYFPMFGMSKNPSTSASRNNPSMMSSPGLMSGGGGGGGGDGQDYNLPPMGTWETTPHVSSSASSSPSYPRHPTSGEHHALRNVTPSSQPQLSSSSSASSHGMGSLMYAQETMSHHGYGSANTSAMHVSQSGPHHISSSYGGGMEGFGPSLTALHHSSPSKQQQQQMGGGRRGPSTTSENMMSRDFLSQRSSLGNGEYNTSYTSFQTQQQQPSSEQQSSLSQQQQQSSLSTLHHGHQVPLSQHNHVPSFQGYR